MYITPSFVTIILNLLTSSKIPTSIENPGNAAAGNPNPIKGHTTTTTTTGYATATTTTAVTSSAAATANAVGDWAASYAKAKAFVSELTNEEKLELITGSDINSSSVSWDALEMKDGSQGVQFYSYVSGFAQSSALAMTWDRDLIYQGLNAVGWEFYLKGFQLVNGPTSQALGRTPWGGRLVETLSPDPYLNGIAFGTGVKAFTDAGVIPGGKASAKFLFSSVRGNKPLIYCNLQHFLLNEQETNRTTDLVTTCTEVYSSNADDKAVHEAYLWPFYDGVKAGLGAVMCAMNKVNGTWACENDHILNDLLKDELGFPGMVYADYNAQHSGLEAAINGLDYGDSDYWNDTSIIDAITEGTFTEERLTDMAIRNVIGYYYVGLDDGQQPDLVEETDFRDVRANHSDIIREIGGASMILLKNKNSALPLQRPHQMSVFGAHAGPVMGGPNQAFTLLGSGPTYQGHLATGSGSAEASLPYLITPQQALVTRAMSNGTMIRWILNDTYTPETFSNAAILYMQSGTGVNPSIPNYAVDSDVCLVFLNALAGEGADRTELYNQDQDTLVNTVASNCNNTIVIINTVGARLVDQWIENDNVTAVLYSSLLGQESGNSIVDVLYGDVNPSGRLTYTIAKNESDYNVTPCLTVECEFTEGVYVDYRYFDKNDITPRYHFGYGLSYTSFKYSDLTLKITNSTNLKNTYAIGSVAVGGRLDLWDDVITLTVKVSNAGVYAGHEVAQLYVAYPEDADQPVRQLRGFERVYIEEGSSETVTFTLRRRDISIWDVEVQEWKVVPGKYTFYVGASAGDLRIWGTLTVGSSS
ncbi:MAG: hypothetical protein M1834_007248 [Cirrosporium novae-zelandiae]|nr:MAG: hypothetical protein M1834_007248 [Cirrosporium novae-zelandiae]